MFSHNGLISEKQNNSLIMIYVFAGGIFVLPHLLAKMFGDLISVGSLVFLLVAALYTGLLFVLGNDDEKICYEKERASGKNAFFTVIQIVRYMIRLIFYIVLTVSVICEGQVPFADKDGGNSVGNIILLLPLLIVAIYGSFMNIEQQGRLSEMIFFSVFLPYVIMLFFGLKESGLPERYLAGGMLPYRDWGNKVMFKDMITLPKMLLRCAVLLAFVVPVEICPWLKSKQKSKSHSYVKTYCYIFAAIAIIVVVSLIMSGIYGVHGMAKEAAASIAIMRYIELPFGVLSRFDVLMVWFFMTACFAYFCTTLFVIRSLIDDVASPKMRMVLLSMIIVLSCVAAYRCPEFEKMLGAYMMYGALVDVPLSIILPIAKKVSANKEKKHLIKVSLIPVFFAMGAFMLNGCSFDIENVEQRDYATVLMMSASGDDTNHYTLGIAKEHRTGEKSEREDFFETDAYDLEDLSKIYAQEKGKELSLSHLKVILTGVKFDKGNLKEKYERFWSFITELDKEQEVAATCPLLLISDEEKVICNMENAEEPVGIYIEELVKIAKKNDKKVPKLMDYLKAVREGKRIDIYELETINEDFIIVSLNKK